MRILLIDDEEATRELTVRTLADEGHDVDVALDSDSALLQYRTNGPYDVVLTDEDHPGVSGQETANLIRAIDPTQRIGFITSCEIVGYPSLFRPCELREINMFVERLASGTTKP